MGTQDTSLERTFTESGNMTFWQENYPFIKDVYLMRQTKMVEWMENVEKAISRIMADKVYTSAEFKRERDNFHALCKDLERAEIKKWLQQILEILMAERGKDERSDNTGKLDVIIAKHEELIPTVLKTQVKVDLYWKCYAYGDELKPHIEFLDGIMLSSTRDIAPSCIENVEELIERQEKSLSQMETKRSIVKDLIAKGKVLLENQTNLSSWTAMLAALNKVGMRPRRKPLPDSTFRIKPRLHGKAMVLVSKLLLLNLKSVKLKSQK